MVDKGEFCVVGDDTLLILVIYQIFDYWTELGQHTRWTEVECISTGRIYCDFTRGWLTLSAGVEVALIGIDV